MQSASDDRQIRRMLERAVPAAYEPLILGIRFHIEPDISCSRFFGMACFTEESIIAYRTTNDGDVLALSELGTFVADRLRGGRFIDIPCGLLGVREPGTDFDMIPLAEKLGVKEYWEIDRTSDVVRNRLPAVMDVTDGGRSYVFTRGIGEIGIRCESGVLVATMQDDVLGFIAKLRDDQSSTPKAIYLSGMQPHTDMLDAQSRRDIAVPYLNALYDELARACAIGDLVILNSGDMLVTGIDESPSWNIHPSLALAQRGFSLMRRCPRNKVTVFLKDR